MIRRKKTLIGAIALSAMLAIVAVASSMTTANNPKDMALGAQFGKKIGPRVALPKIKVGILQIVGQIESAQRTQSNLQQAATALGWSYQVCDAQGDTTKMATCMDTLLLQGSKIIFNIAVDPAVIKTQLQKAKSQGVPVFTVAGATSTSKGFAGYYPPDEYASGTLASQWMIDKLDATATGKKTVAALLYSAGLFAKLREDAFFALVKKHPDIKVVATKQLDLKDPNGSAVRLTQSLLLQYPKLSAIWISFDAPIAGAGTVLATKYPGKTYPGKPLLVGFNANLSTSNLIRKGVIDAVSDSDFTTEPWVAFDQAAEWVARKKTPIATSKFRGFYPIQLDQPRIVTRANVPPKGQYVKNPNDVPSFFKGKWKAEFSLGK